MERPTLLFDLGNRRLKLAELEADRPVAATALDLPFPEGDWTRFLEPLADRVRGRRVRLSSVNPGALARIRDGAFCAAAEVQVAGERGWPMEVLSRGTGADRVMAAWAAWRRCGGPLVVADLGTAWTLDLVDAAGRFRGGAIGPGLALQRQALARACPHLPVGSEGDPDGIPEDSSSAVAAGTRVALADALRACRDRMADALGEPGLRAFLTGGDVAAIAPSLGPGWELTRDLVLEGLAGWEPAPG